MSVCEIAVSVKMLKYIYRFREIYVTSLPLALIHSRYVTEYSDIQCIFHHVSSHISVRGSAFTSRSLHSCSLSLSLILAFSLDHVHTLRTLIPQRYSPARSFLQYFSFISLCALTRPHFHWFANFPTKSESSYLARKKNSITR